MSLDDLFDPEPLPGDGRPGWRQQLGWLVRAVLGSVAAGGAIIAVLLMFDYRMWYPAAPAAFFAALVLFRAVSTLAVNRVAGQPDRLPERAEAPRCDGREPAVNRWDARLRGRRHGRSALREPLAALVDERLRQRHGCTLTSAPDRARQLLGEPLWTYLTGSVSRDPRPAELAAILTTVEEL